MLSAYPACFFKEKDGYSVIFPGLNHLATCGDTLDEALFMAIDCLAGYLFEAKKSGETIPSPLSLKDVTAARIAKEIEYDEYEEVFTNIVTVDVEEYAKAHFNKSVKKTLTIPEWLNTAAKDAGVNFSQVLQEALMQKIKM